MLIIVILVLLVRRKRRDNKALHTTNVAFKNNQTHDDTEASAVDHPYSTIDRIKPSVKMNNPAYDRLTALHTAVAISPTTEQHDHVNAHNDHRLYDSIRVNTINDIDDGNPQACNCIVDVHLSHSDKSAKDQYSYGVINQPTS